MSGTLRLAPLLLVLAPWSLAHAEMRYEKIPFAVDSGNRFFEAERNANFRIAGVAINPVTIGRRIDRRAYDACVREEAGGDVSELDCERRFVEWDEAPMVEVIVEYDPPTDGGGVLRFRFLPRELRPEVIAAIRGGDRKAARAYFEKTERHTVRPGAAHECDDDDEHAPAACETVWSPTPQYVVSVVPL